MEARNTSRYGIVLGTLIFSAVASVAQISRADDAAPVPGGAKRPGEKLDISDLENKYWAPKDTDFSVVQNRTYTKDGRFFLTGHFGRPVNDQWSVGNVGGASLNYFWSERFGVQGTFLSARLNNNKAADFIATNYGSGIYADHNRFRTYYGAAFTVVPFYAKMSFWGTKILYFDMAFSPTIGTTNYEQQIRTGNRDKSALTYGIDVTQYFFFTNYFAVRLDLKNQWHKEEISKFYSNTGSVRTGQKVKDETAQDTLFLLGLTFFY